MDPRVAPAPLTLSGPARDRRDEVRPASASAPSSLDDHLVSLLAPASFAAEQYRTLRHMIEQAKRAVGLTVVAVSSPAPGDGKTTTAINLAGTLAQAAGARVLLTDLDLRRPSVAACLGLRVAEDRGLVAAIADSGLGLADITLPVPSSALSVVVPGPAVKSPYELFKAPRLMDLLEEARQVYDYVILDTPPLIPMPDCQILAGAVDGFLVVVTGGKTPRRLLGDALNVLTADKVLGLVFNRHDQPLSSYGYHTYGQNPPAGARWSRAAQRVVRSLRQPPASVPE
jgi:capsular exopolysaccharide synthesis family protein